MPDACDREHDCRRACQGNRDRPMIKRQPECVQCLWKFVTAAQAGWKPCSKAPVEDEAHRAEQAHAR